jgi:hypothetical protein
VGEVVCSVEEVSRAQRNTHFYDSARLDLKGKMGLVSHINRYKINNSSKNVHIFKPIMPL